MLSYRTGREPASTRCRCRRKGWRADRVQPDRPQQPRQQRRPAMRRQRPATARADLAGQHTTARCSPPARAQPRSQPAPRPPRPAATPTRECARSKDYDFPRRLPALPQLPAIRRGIEVCIARRGVDSSTKLGPLPLGHRTHHLLTCSGSNDSGCALQPHPSHPDPEPTLAKALINLRRLEKEY
jgi:hypothetical protein